MYDNKPIGIPINEEKVNVPTENLQQITVEIMEMAKECRGLSTSIQGGLYGSQLQETEGKEPNVYCLLDALKQIRYTLGERIYTLRDVNKGL